jgi:amino acid transporter
MVFVLFTYGGWNEMAYVGAEVRNPNKNILRAMLLGTVAVTAIYLLVTCAFVHALGLEGARAKTAPADMLGLALGDWAGKALALLVCISALGAVNGNIFTGSRIFYALGTEHRLYSRLGQWSGKRRTPVASLLLQGAITLALVVWFGPTERSAEGIEQSGFGKMVIFTTPAFWFFLMLVGLAVAELRFREPDTPRPYRTVWYPLPPIILCLLSMFMVYSSVKWAILNESWEVIWSVAILALGVAMSFLDPPARSRP